MFSSLVEHLATIIILVGGVIAATGAFRADAADKDKTRILGLKPAFVILLGTVIGLTGVLGSEFQTSLFQTRLISTQSELLAAEKLNSDLAMQLSTKSEELLSWSGRVNAKSDEIASLSHRLLAKNEEMLSLSGRLAAKSEEIITLHQQLATKSEQNSDTRKHDLETREVTIERLIRLVASDCVNKSPELQKKIEAIHDQFERGLTDTLSIGDSISTEENVPAPPKQ